MLKNFRFISVALTIVLCFSAIAFGQGTSGSIEGTVKDSTGAVIPGATVKVESTGSTAGFNRTVTADDEGYYIIARVPPGTYKVTINVDNFEPFSQNVTVVVDRSQNVSPNLSAAGTTTTVDVVADSAVTIDTTDTKIDTNITKEIIESLPKGTTFTSILKIAPNVRPEAIGGGLQIDGASGSENVFVIDGQEVTNFATGTLNSNNNLPFELLQEVQVKSTGFEAEYGGATGGVINAVTAGGNNQWRGNFGISFRPSQLQASPNRRLNDFGNAGDPGGGFDYFTPRKDGGTDFFPVASVSGPILKDRIWGLVSYAPQIFETSRTKDFFNTDDPGRQVVFTDRYDSKTRIEQAFSRIDAQPFSSLRVYGTFLWNPRIDEGEVPGLGLSQNLDPVTREEYAARGGRVNSNAFNTQATWTPLNWMVVNFRAGRSFLNEKLFSYGRVAGQRIAVSSFSPLDPCDVIPGRTDQCRGFNTGSNELTAFDVSTRTTYDADVSFVGVNAFGRHNIKAGYQLNQLYNNVDRGYTSTGYILLYYGRPTSFYTGINGLPICPDLANGNFPNDDSCSLGTARMVRIGTRGEASSDNTALYAQDSWQINNRFTINFGLRAEREVVPSFGDPATTTDIEFDWTDKLAPRFGAAVDLFGDGKTKIFGSYGWFYDRFKYELPRGLFGAEAFLDAFGEILPSRGLSPFDYTLQAMLAGRTVTESIGGSCPITGTTGWATCELDRRVPSNAVGANPFAGAGAVDPDLKAMRQSEYTFGVEQLLGDNFVLAARYTHKQLDRAIEDIGSFNDQGSEAYVIGNPGRGLACEVATQGGFPCTEAERIYDGVEVRVDKRAANYFFNASYTYSRLFGNYSGLASSDELGRNSPNVNRFFDLPMLGYNANGEPDNGRLATDRPHVFKAYGGYSYNWDRVNRTNFSGFTTIQSGTPLTTVYSLYGVGTSILFGRGDLGRTEAFTETDFAVSHQYRFGRDNKWTFEAFMEIRNIFDERNELGVQRAFSTGSITGIQLEEGGCTTCVVRNADGSVNNGLTESASLQRIFNGGIQQFVVNFFNANPGQTENDFNQVNSFQGGRDVRFGFKFRF